MKMVGSDGAGGRERSERCRDGGGWVREGKKMMGEDGDGGLEREMELLRK